MNNSWARRWTSRSSSRPLQVLLIASAALVLSAMPSLAQDGNQRRYLPDRSDEDWSFLKNAAKIDRWDSLKYIPFGDTSGFATLSGEVRFRPEAFRIPATDERPATIDNYLLQRYIFGADIRMSSRARVFAELQSGIINGQLRSPRPTDQNTLDVHQAFFEWRQPLGRYRFVAKAGRHELAIGSTRLISASPGLNVKRSFDGAGVTFLSSTWSFGGVAARLVGSSAGAFDDRWERGQLFWGAAAARRNSGTGRGEFGGYYLGIDRKDALYAQAGGDERRHTIGLKWTATGGRLTLNYDGIFQWGTFNSGPIRAWAFASETSYVLSPAGWRPRVGVRADVASGDRDQSNRALQSFNPLFPGNAYSGAVGLLGPTNLTDFTPALTISPRPNLSVGFESPSYWRTSTEDGVYGTDLRLLIRPNAGDGRYIGTNPGVVVVWQATRHCQLQGAITRFLSGGFLADTFVSSGFGFYSVSAVYRF